MLLLSRKKDERCAVRNANFDRVLSVVNRHLDASRSRDCTCEQCVNAIIALALNYLPPHYYVDNQREHEVGSPWVMVESAVAEAVERRRERVCRRIARIED